VPLAVLGEHQCENAALAVAGVEALRGGPVSSAGLRAAYGRLRLPGQLESFQGNPIVLLDGAHNPGAAAVLARTVADRFPGAARTLVVAQLSGRDPAAFLQAARVGPDDVVIATVPPHSQAVPAAVIADQARALGARAVSVPEPEHALRRALAVSAPGGIVIVTGSLRLAGAVRPALAPHPPRQRLDRSARSPRRRVHRRSGRSPIQ
jgi:dihydrofolate synthase / folylpolyglutamate synthase